jgi:hypothetical protein
LRNIMGGSGLCFAIKGLQGGNSYPPRYPALFGLGMGA